MNLSLLNSTKKTGNNSQLPEFIIDFFKEIAFDVNEECRYSDLFTEIVIEVPRSIVFWPSITRLAGFELSSLTSRRRSLLIRWGRDDSR